MEAPGRRPRASEAGFGLVEVLVALTILAFGLLAVAGLTWSVTRQTRGAAVRTGQTLAARQVIDATVARGYEALGVGASDTTVAVGERSYTVTLTVTQVGEGLRELSATVSGTEGVAPYTFATRVRRDRSPP